MTDPAMAMNANMPKTVPILFVSLSRKRVVVAPGSGGGQINSGKAASLARAEWRSASIGQSDGCCRQTRNERLDGPEGAATVGHREAGQKTGQEQKRPRLVDGSRRPLFSDLGSFDGRSEHPAQQQPLLVVDARRRLGRPGAGNEDYDPRKGNRREADHGSSHVKQTICSLVLENAEHMRRRTLALMQRRPRGDPSSWLRRRDSEPV